MTIRVLLADDQSLVRAGLRMVMQPEDDLEVVAEAENGNEAIFRCERFQPDVALLDIRMPELDGIEAARAITSRAGNATRVLMLTNFDLDEYVYDALRAGASGFLLKDAPPERIVDAVRTIAAGDSLLAPSVTRRVIEQFATRPSGATPDPRVDQLTDREREVLLLIARGLSNRELAEHLVVSEATVKTHVNRILGKLPLRDRVQAVVLAYETGLVSPGDQPIG
jgi:DNA-binding NarL/FixJ family response regulator